MPTGPRHKKIDTLMEKASKALTGTDYFRAERLAGKALMIAFQSGDYERMARILLPLQEARRQRVQQALDAGFAGVMDADPIADDVDVEPGCYLVRPPRVGADARRLRLSALTREIPVVVVCREPTTILRLCPVVSTLPGKSFRTQIDLPADPDQPETGWFLHAIEMLGDAAIEDMDEERPVEKRIEYLLECLEAIPEHEVLHQVLADLCREAHHAQQEDASAGAVT